MTIRYKIDPLEKDIQVWLDQALGPEARSKVFANYAQEVIDDAKAVNTQTLGRTPEYEQWVDGNRGAPLQSVKPEGKIIVEFDFMDDVFVWIRDMLEQHSPVGETGRYQRSHKFFVDGRETDPTQPVAIKSIAWFVSNKIYARKLERIKGGAIYQAVAKLAAQRFGNVARIRYGFRFVNVDPEGTEQRNPAIDIFPR